MDGPLISGGFYFMHSIEKLDEVLFQKTVFIVNLCTVVYLIFVNL